MSRGVSRIEERLSSKIADGEFYEAHQMIRTLASRYRTSKKHQDALKLITKGALQLYELKQCGSASDLGILYCTILDDVEKITETNEEQISKIHRATINHLEYEQPERDQFERRILKRTAEICGNQMGSPKTRLSFAQNYLEASKAARTAKAMDIFTVSISSARQHFQYSENGREIAKFLAHFTEFSSRNMSEIELICTQMLLQLLHQRTVSVANEFLQAFSTFHPQLESRFPSNYPLLNYCFFLLKTIDSKDVKAFKFLNFAYQPFLADPDPILMEYVVRIGEIYFGIVEKKARPQGGFMDIIGSLMGGKPNLSSDSEDDESEGPAGLDMGALMNMANDMFSGMMQGPPGANRAPSSAITQPPADEDVDDLD